MSNIIHKAWLVFILVFLAWSPARAAAPEGQAPEPSAMLVVDGSFFFAPGSWASYDFLDKKENNPSVFRIAAIRDESRNGKNYWRLEVSIDGTDKKTGQPVSAVTSFLVEQTPNGPGDVGEAIVQPKGYEPFIVPDYMMEKANKDQKNKARRVIKPDTSRMKEITVRHEKSGKVIKAFQTEAVDDNNNPVKAIISTEVKPIGLVYADSKDFTFSMIDFGGGAMTGITGEPLGFLAWIAVQVSKAMQAADTAVTNGENMTEQQIRDQKQYDELMKDLNE